MPNASDPHAFLTHYLDPDLNHLVPILADSNCRSDEGKMTYYPGQSSSYIYKEMLDNFRSRIRRCHSLTLEVMSAEISNFYYELCELYPGNDREIKLAFDNISSNLSKAGVEIKITRMAQRTPLASTPGKPPSPANHKARKAVIVAIVVIAILVPVIYFGVVQGDFGQYLPFLTSDNGGHSQGVGAISVDQAQFYFASPDYVTAVINNTGTRALTIVSAYIDNSSAAVTGNNLTLLPNQRITCYIIASGPPTIGNPITLELVASDGTNTTYVITSEIGGALAIISASITSPNTMIVYVANVCDQNEIISSAHVDNSLVDLGLYESGSMLIAPGNAVGLTLTGYGTTNWEDGATHLINIVAADGTTVTSNVSYSPGNIQTH